MTNTVVLFIFALVRGDVVGGTQSGTAPVRWPTPTLDEHSYSRWLAFIRPSADELKWRRVRWHKHLSDAAEEARRLERPILLFTMNGHPCGET